ncbi:hypothetical protein PG988_001564 [Apiospora saccharicola]
MGLLRQGYLTGTFNPPVVRPPPKGDPTAHTSTSHSHCDSLGPAQPRHFVSINSHPTNILAQSFGSASS